jgi:hypothetical protein
LLFAEGGALGAAAGFAAAVLASVAPSFSSWASKLTTRCAPYAFATRARLRSEGR